MITKLKSKEFFLSSTLALGVVAGVGIATAPAQAGTLEWDNGTSSFIENFYTDDADPTDGIVLSEIELPDDPFNVTFSPASLGGQAAVFIATDEFAPFFGGLPEFFPINGGSGATGNFSVTSPLSPDLTFDAVLNNDLTFNFGNDVSVTIGGGTTFLGDFDTNNGNIEGLQFEEDTVSTVTVNIDGQEYNIGDDDFPVIGEELTFGQAVGSEGDGGGYQGEVVVGVTAPEPATILGLLAVGGLGLGLKRKK